MTALVASAVALAILLPHGSPLERATPVVAAAAWCAALTIRAVAVVYVVVCLALFLPHTDLFASLAHWCWETSGPFRTTEHGLEGHHVGGGAVALPAAVLAVSAISALCGTGVAARAVAGLLRRDSLGSGPRDSVIVGGAEVVLATAGLTRPQVLVSAGALITLDDEELAAGLDHERGHIARRHRYVLLYAELCRVLARPLPGTHHATREVRFHLERDADRWALARRHDPHALAGAICKASRIPLQARVRMASLEGGDVARRLDELLASPAPGGCALRAWSARAAAVVLSCLALGLTVCVPVTVADGLQQLGNSARLHCEH